MAQAALFWLVLLAGAFAALAGARHQPVEPGPFYDNVMGTSSKTTFDAVTHALLRIQMTDAAGAPAGRAGATDLHRDDRRGPTRRSTS